jgi:hypothetical protein
MAVHLNVPADGGQNQLWGIPLVGIVVRWFLCIPQLIVLALLGVVMWFIAWISWIPILLNGRQADAIVDVFALIARIQSRVTLYGTLATGAYPGLIDPPHHPIRPTIDRAEPQNQLWGIPVFGIVIRAILVIPHAVVLWALGVVAAFVVLVSWIPVLVSGRQADAIVSFLAGFYRYSLRVAAYVTLVTGQYPPFRLAD